MLQSGYSIAFPMPKQWILLRFWFAPFSVVPCIFVCQIPADVGLLAREPGCTSNLFVVEGHSERNGRKSRGWFNIAINCDILVVLFLINNIKFEGKLRIGG